MGWAPIAYPPPKKRVVPPTFLAIGTHYPPQHKLSESY